MYSNYNYNKEEFIYSWPIIILALYMFFPIGIYLIIKKSKLHRRNIFTIGNKTFSSGLSLIIFGALFYLPKIMLLFTNVFNDSVNASELETVVNSPIYSKIVGYGNFFIALGLIILLISCYQKSKAKIYQKYISLVVNKEKENLDEIANRMKLGKAKVISDLETMISRRYLENYEVDIEENRIYDIAREKRKREEKGKYTRVVKCPNCRADNMLVDKIGKCDYCKSYIE